MAASTEIATIDVTSELATEVAHAVGQVMADPYADPDAFARQAREASRRFPREIRMALSQIREQHGPPAVLLRGLPVPATLPATPDTAFDRRPQSAALGSERMLASVAAPVGEMFAYQEWQNGRLVQNHYPIAGHAGIQAASGSTELVLHTEASFAAVSPDHLVLYGLRADPARAAFTVVADAVLALGLIPSEARGRLTEPLYAFETDRGTHLLNGRRTTEPRPIVRIDGTVEYGGLLTATTRAGHDALAAFAEALTATAVRIELGPGDALVIDNRRAVHGRTAFRPAFDGRDRWIQRVLLRRHLPAGRRVVSDTRFAQYPAAYQQAITRPS